MRGITLWECSSLWRSFKGVSEMYLNTQMLHSLMNRHSLLGVYWAIVLVISLRAHAGNKLVEIEMMKRIGGQSPAAWCATYTGDSCCTDKLCPDSCPLDYLYQDCLVQYTPFKGPIAQSTDGYCPEVCNNVAGNQYCTTGNLQQVNCNAFYNCGCVPNGEEASCTSDPEPASYECYQIDVGTGGVPCAYTPCGQQ